MVENVQCPVCTLFLHAGMNLSDHLETHPKEQVIKALVQMTISGGIGGGAALAAVLAADSDTKTEECVDVKTIATETEQDFSKNLLKSSLSITIPSITVTTASAVVATPPQSSFATPSASNSVTSPSLFEALPLTNSNLNNPPIKQKQTDVRNAPPTTSTAAIVSAVVHKNHNSPTLSAAETSSPTTASTPSTHPAYQTLPTDFSGFNANRFQQQQRQQQHTQSNSQLQHQQHQHRSGVFPAPPPPSVQPIQLTSAFNATMQQKTTQQQQLHHQHRHFQQHQQHQNLKVIYSPSLPPPPPLQLFTHQPTVTQHQKPPPAYGAAISQIRSQHNQNKQHQQQHVAGLHMPTTSTAVTPSSSSSSTTVTTVTTMAKLPFQNTKLAIAAHLPPPPPPPPLPAPLKYPAEGLTAPTTQTQSPLLHQPQFSAQQHHQPQQQPQQQQQKHQHTITPISITSHSASVHSATTSSASSLNLSRQTSSPFATLLNAAVPSPSSVLRFAESPVAHYLERDNGDFIVQETPKHIVECVEKEDGDFSVIERIYQSPPSVLHIHDDDDDDDEDNKDDIKDEVLDEKPEISDRMDNDNSVNNDATTSSTLSNTNKEVKKVAVEDDEEEFMSINSDDESYTEEIVLPNTRSKSQQRQLLSTAPSTSAAANGTASNANTSSDTNSSSNSSSRKSKKNTITVLSDVPLNLNEYLDLVGNIIASSKVANRRPTFTAIAPLPLVKVEKEEPLDDYEVQQQERDHEEQPQQAVEEQCQDSTFEFIKDIKVVETSSELSCLESEQPPTQLPITTATTKPPTYSPNANENETDELVVNSNKHITKTHNISKTKPQTQQQQQQLHQQQRQLNSIGNDLNMLASCSSNSSSSHVTTSVIRMATTSHLTHPLKQPEQQSDNAVAEDLTQPQLKVEVEQTTFTPQRFPLAQFKRGPKKLIIKPKQPTTNSNNNKSTIKTNNKKTDNNNVDVAALSVSSDDVVLIKNEPINNVYDCQPTTSSSILENHLKSKSTDGNRSSSSSMALAVSSSSYAFATSCTTSKTASANFLSANSIFSSSTAIGALAVNQASVVNTEETHSFVVDPFNKSLRCEEEYILPDNNDLREEIVISSSSYSSQSANDLSLNASQLEQQQLDKQINEKSTDQHEHQSHHSHHQHHRDDHQQPQATNHFNDYTFNFLYNPSNVTQHHVVDATKSTTNSNFSSFNYEHHHQHAHDATNAATVASSSVSSVLNDDSTNASKSSHQPQTTTEHQQTIAASAWYHHQHHHHNQQQHQLNHPTHHHHQTTDFNSALAAVDCTAAVDGGDIAVGKYLDLDACKRESISGAASHTTSVSATPLLPSSASSLSSSSTSLSSFAAGTESSLAGGCTADALNMRTDEKMPAKGEISEQESNCDIENSWSQSMYGDISARFFRTSFPGIFPHDNGWHHDDYFPAQDLTAANANAATSANGQQQHQQRGNKSFEFRLPVEATTSATAAAATIGTNIFQQHVNDALPSTSTSTAPATVAPKKKRKRNDVAAPTSTITSQQMLLLQQKQQHHLHSSQLVQLAYNDPQQPTTSAALLAGPSTAAAAATSTSSSTTTTTHGNGIASSSAVQQPKPPRRKIYKCTHCAEIFAKLKYRNSHMILDHNYVRQNRRLICSQNIVTSTITSADLATVATPSANLLAQQTAAAFLMQQQQCPQQQQQLQQRTNDVEDSKQGIVKIEMDNSAVEQQQQLQRQLQLQQQTQLQQQHQQQQHQTQETQSLAMTINEHNIHAKTEFIDEKYDGVLASTSAANGLPTAPNVTNTFDGTVAIAGSIGKMETKPNLQQLAITTPATKLATLYRMLISYNISILKQNSNLSDTETKFIESSIFLCYVCRQNFTSVKQYDAHLTEHPAECYTCGKKFQRWKNFSLHLKRHLGWKEFGCNVCDKKFVVRSALVEHMRMHTGHTPLNCKICGKKFKRYSNLTQHRKRHGKQILRRKEYVCHCGEVLPSKARFLWHKETHDSKPKCCPHCCDRFVHANSLRRHIRLAHSDKFDYTEPMECPMCKQIFAKTSIKAHMATHSMDTQYDCTICNKSFSTKWNLKIHSWVHANRTAKPFKCEHCPKAFVREVDFKNHMNAHKQIKPYTCEYCGCKFIRKYNYMRHRREHHGKKKFTCDLCKKSFHRHYYLIEHRRIHTGERPFQCTICGKSSTTKTNHNKHLKIHHSRDPFTVEV